jgi:hypothetical protein
MREIIAWLDQQHVNFAALLTSTAVLILAGLSSIAGSTPIASMWHPMAASCGCPAAA